MRYYIIQKLMPAIIINATFITALFLTPAGAQAATYSASLSIAGSVELNVSAMGNGANIVSDEVVVNSTCPYGYNLSIVGPTDTTLYKDSDSSSTHRINPTSGTKQNPKEIIGVGNLNTWGYSTTSNDTTGGFIALTNTPDELASTTAASGTGGDTHSIYYGASVSIDTPTGVYKMKDASTTGKITYTLTPKEDCMSYLVHFDPSGYFEGNLISGTGTMSDQRIYEGIPTALSSNTFTAPSGYYFAGWNTAQDGSGTSYTDGQSVTDIAAVGSTVTLYAQWTNCQAGYICFFPNATGVTDSMADQSITASQRGAQLWPSNFYRSGYGFAGWNTKPDGTGTTYGPSQNIRFTAGQYSGVRGGLSLYAKWVPQNYFMMQEWEGTLTCNDLRMGEVTASTDLRNNETYAIAKLADGRCWMIENLRLSKDNGNYSFYNTNTNNPSNAFNGTVLPDPTDQNTTPWCTSNTAACIDQTLYADYYRTLSGYSNPNSMTNRTQPAYSRGAYYNWYTATLGRGTYNTVNGNASGDICPNGWHIPSGGATTSDFAKLSIALGGTGDTMSTPPYIPDPEEIKNNFFSYPNNFIESAQVYGGYSGNHGDQKYYWSQTSGSTNQEAYMFASSIDIYNGTILYPGNDARAKYYGAPVRCIFGN